MRDIIGMRWGSRHPNHPQKLSRKCCNITVKLENNIFCDYSYFMTLNLKNLN